MSRWGYGSLEIVATVAHFDGKVITLLVVRHRCRNSSCFERGDANGRKGGADLAGFQIKRTWKRYRAVKTVQVVIGDIIDQTRRD